MNKILGILLVITLIVGLSAGCKDKSTQNTDGKPLVYASFYPMYDLALKAAGDASDVRCLVPDGAEPHDWEPAPQDIIGLEKADLLICSGAGIEEWADSIIPKLKNKKLTVLNASEAESAQGDPHTWLSPVDAKRQFHEISMALMAIDGENRDEYAANYERWIMEFDKLDEEYQILKELPKNKIIVTHAAFGHLCEAYGLEQIAIKGISPEDEPDPARMAEVIKLAKEDGAKYVFYEELSSSKLAQIVADEIGASILPLSPIEGLSAKEREDGADYFSLMRKNLAALKEALS